MRLSDSPSARARDRYYGKATVRQKRAVLPWLVLGFGGLALCAILALALTGCQTDASPYAPSAQALHEHDVRIAAQAEKIFADPDLLGDPLVQRTFLAALQANARASGELAAGLAKKPIDSSGNRPTEPDNAPLDVTAPDNRSP